MQFQLFKLFRTAFFCLGISLCSHTGAAEANWPQFRGPQASGVSPDEVPVTWNVDSGENIRWRRAIPGLGHASPIIWKNRIYVATALVPGKKAELKVGLYGEGNSFQEKEPHQWRLLCVDKTTGNILWDKLEFEAVPRLERHTKASHCNSTPATDGKRIVAIFGSEGIFCFGMDGSLRWHKDLGRMDAGPYNAPDMQWGFASSPVLYKGKVIVQCDVLSEQYLTVLDARDGREIWKTPRKDVATWSTPLIAAQRARTEVVANGWTNIAGYDFRSGRELWRLRGGGDIPVASPIRAGDFAILTSGHGQYRPMRAVRLESSGDITPSEMGGTNRFVPWCHPRKGNYLQTPIVIGDLLWGCSNDGILTCFDLHSGQIYYEERLGTGGQGFTASPVVAGGKLYLTGEQGDVFVLPATKHFSILATNQLGSLCLSTPSISQGTLFFRTTEELVAVGRKRGER